MYRFSGPWARALAAGWLAAACAGLGTVSAQEIVPPDRPISMDEAIRIAEQNTAVMASGEESVFISRQRVLQARSPLLPNVTADLSYNGRGTSTLGGIFGSTTQPVGVGANTATFDQGPIPIIRARQTLFDAGQTRIAVHAARVGVENAEAGLQATRNNLGFTVSTTYLAQLRNQAVLALRDEQVRQAQQQLQDVLERIRVGALAEVERYLPESQLRNTEVDRVEAENDLRVAAANLRNVMGLPPGPPLQLIEPVEPPDAQILAPLAELQAQAMRQRPEVLQDESSLRIAQADIQLARLQRRPLPTADVAVNVTPRGEVSKSDFAVGANISFLVFDSGLALSRERVARANARSAAAQLAQTKKDVATDVEAAWLNYVSALQRVDAALAASQAANRNLEATNERFRLGAREVTVVDLVTAQLQFFTANNNLVSARYDVTLARKQLQRAVGR